MANWRSKHYRDHSEAQKARALKIVDKISPSGNEMILDVGCGDGKITKTLSELVPHGSVIGIDSCLDMIQLATIEHREVHNLQFLHTAAEGFVSSEKFDIITSFNSLHWLHDHEKFVQNLKLNLKQNGKIYFLLASGGKNAYVDKILSKAEWRSHFCELERFHQTMETIDYSKLLSRQGISVDFLEIRDETYRFENLDLMTENIMSWLPAVTDLSLQTCRNLAREISLLAAKKEGNLTVYELTFAMLEIEGHLDTISESI